MMGGVKKKNIKGKGELKRILKEGGSKNLVIF